jgi:hypothetical protein
MSNFDESEIYLKYDYNVKALWWKSNYDEKELR